MSTTQTQSTRYETQAEEIADLTAQLEEAKAMLRTCSDPIEGRKIMRAMRWIRNDLNRARRG